MSKGNINLNYRWGQYGEEIEGVKTIRTSFLGFVEGCLDLLLDLVNVVYAVVEFTGELLGLAVAGLGGVLFKGLV